MACVPQIYQAMAVSLAKQIRSGEILDDTDVLKEYLEKREPRFANAIIRCARKLLKYPDIQKAGWDANYRREYDESIGRVKMTNKITFKSHKTFLSIKEMIEKEIEEDIPSLDELVQYSADYLINRYFQSCSMIRYEKDSIYFIREVYSPWRQLKVEKLPKRLFYYIKKLKFDFMSKDEDGSGLAGYAENQHVFITKDFCKEGESQFNNNDLGEKLREINEKPGIIFVKMRKKNGDCALVTLFEKNRIKLNMPEIRLGLENYYAPAAIIPSENVIAEYAGIEKLLSAGWNYGGYIKPDNDFRK